MLFTQHNMMCRVWFINKGHLHCLFVAPNPYSNLNEHGWNEYCREAHVQTRGAFMLWCSHGKSQNGPLLQLMQKTPSHLKYSLRCCHKHVDRSAAGSIAKWLLTKDTKTFWKEVKFEPTISMDIHGCLS